MENGRYKVQRNIQGSETDGAFLIESQVFEITKYEGRHIGTNCRLSKVHNDIAESHGYAISEYKVNDLIASNILKRIEK